MGISVNGGGFEGGMLVGVDVGEMVPEWVRVLGLEGVGEGVGVPL